MSVAPAVEARMRVAEQVAACYDNPLLFVESLFPWRQPGKGLEHEDGPDVWQAAFLTRLGAAVKARAFDGRTPVAPIRMAVSKGHGVGGSTLAAWLTLWIMATRRHAHGTITANTRDQLRDKTWAAVRQWRNLCLVGDWFEINTERMYHQATPGEWFCSSLTCRDENSEAFQGQHARDSTSFYIFDESSAVPDSIFTAAEGGLTDGESMIFLFGNPTRSSGAFHQACFGAGRARWDVVTIDSRTSQFTNQAQIAEWIEDYGEDSDFVRVRVRGLPPRASDLQFIPADRVFDAQRREVDVLPDEPLRCGLDVARGGFTNCVFTFRRGSDARTIPVITIPGEEARDSMVLVAKAVDLLEQHFDGRKIEMLFVDGTGIGGPIVDRLNQLGYQQRVMEVQFGSQSTDPKYANMRAFMWGKMRDWLVRGAIADASVLEQDLVGPDYTHDKRDRVLLESKEHMVQRHVASPDYADSLALTFASDVTTRIRRQERQRRRQRFEGRASRQAGGRFSWAN